MPKKQLSNPLQLPLLIEKTNFSQDLKAMAMLRHKAMRCQSCDLHENRQVVVFGEGPVRARLAIVGEAPGEAENTSGRPFVGRAGHQLTRMLAAMGLTRQDVFLTNAVLCQPLCNRTPTKAELGLCKTYLYGQLRAVKPEVILCLGKTAATAMLPVTQSLEDMRMEWYEWENIPVRVSFHPSFLIRPEGEGFKGHAWLDLKVVMQRLGLPIPTNEEANARSSIIPEFGWKYK